MPTHHPWGGVILITQHGPTLKLFKQIERELGTAAPLVNIAQKSCDAFYETFEQSVVLVRVFATVPFAMLMADEQAISRAVLERKQISDPVESATPVMTLLGTRGVEKSWCDRHTSQGHRAFPLVSRLLIESMPMTAQLLRVLGSERGAAGSSESGITEKVWGAGRAALFYVEHAAHTLDAQGRKIIGAQSFVEQYGVQTVFGAARAYRDDLFLVQLFFCRHHVSRKRAREFLPLVGILRGTTIRAIDSNNVFPKN